MKFTIKILSFGLSNLCYYYFKLVLGIGDKNIFGIMTRGNARDLAREKNMKKQQEQAKRKSINDKGCNKGMTLEQRRQRDAELIREKQRRAAEEKQRS